MMDGSDARLIIDYGEMTHPGGREENQDYLNAFLDDKNEVYCFVIADGLGGHAGGRNASQIAVESIFHSLAEIHKKDEGKWLSDALQEAHDSIKRARKADASLRNMGTTCVTLIILNGKAYWASVGDSRIYVIRNKAILHRSKDHSIVQVLLDMGEIKPKDVRGHPDRNRVLRTLGMDEDVEPTVNAEGLVLQRGDSILLCTDGFWEYVSDSAIVRIIHKHLNVKAQKLLDALFTRVIAIARTHKERHDNLSAQLIMVK